MDRPVGPLVPARVDAVGGERDLGRRSDVRGREAELAAPPVALDDHTPDLVISAEHRRSGLEIATARAPVTNRGGRHRLALPRRCDETERLDLEAVDGAHLPEKGHVAGPPMSEVEVLADDHAAGIEAIDEHLLDEVLGRLGCPRLVERDHDRCSRRPSP